ncbi:MAG: hypothetical protein IPP06_06645 [Saprospiraceae bacterium]|nr:hypothetical protein [Candidatus Vicinibacter affinis]
MNLLFYKVIEDEHGNYYSFGSFLAAGEFPNFKGLVVKISGTGNIIWQKIYPFAGYGICFYNVLPLNNDRFLLVGNSIDPINFFNNQEESYIYTAVMDTSGRILNTNFKNKSYRNSIVECCCPDSTLGVVVITDL